MLLMPNSDPTTWMMQQETHQTSQLNVFPSSIAWLVCVKCTVSYVSWHEWQQVGLLLFQGSTCCAFRDGVLYILIVMSGSLTYCRLYVTPNQYGHSPVTSCINQAFSRRDLLLTGYFVFLHHSLASLQMVVHGNPWRSVVSEILRPATMVHPSSHPRIFYTHFNPIQGCGVWRSPSQLSSGERARAFDYT